MQNVTFVIKTKAPESLLTSPAKRGPDDPDVVLEFGLARHAPGISTTEVLINVAIGLASGVPAGVAANWLFVRLGLGRDTKLYDQTGTLLASVKEIESKLETLSKQVPN
ncbi:hypothetical protein [Hydrogenophaga soli]